MSRRAVLETAVQRSFEVRCRAEGLPVPGMVFVSRSETFAKAKTDAEKTLREGVIHHKGREYLPTVVVVELVMPGRREVVYCGSME